MPYKNDKGEDITADQYVSAKYKQLFSKDGAEVFKSIQSDKNLTPEERQKACLAIGKAATQYECQQAKGHEETLMRGNTGQVQFISAYIKANAKTYVDAVAENGKRAIQEKGLSEKDVSEKILSGYTTELPKLSKEAAEFMKVTSDVVKTELPGQSESLTARILQNNVSLRGASTNITVWLKALDPENKKAINVKTTVAENNEKANEPLKQYRTDVGNAKDKVEKLEKELLGTEGELEKRVVQKNLDQAREELVKTEKVLEKEFKVHEANINKVAKEGEEMLEPYKDRLAMIERGMRTNNLVQVAVNSTEGFDAPDEIGETGLDISRYNESLGDMAKGTIKGLEVSKDIDLPKVDMAGVKKEVDSENLERDKQAKIKSAEGQTALRKQEKETFGEAQKKAGPELAKIAAMEKQLDGIVALQRLRKDPEKPLLDANKQPVPPYKPSAGDKFKAFFAKGGMDEVLSKKRDQLTQELDKLKIEVQVKTDLDFSKEVAKSHEVGNRELAAGLRNVERGAQFYEAAREQVAQAERELTIEARLLKSDLPSQLTMNPEKREQVLQMKAEGEKAMLKYEGDFLEHEMLSQQRGMNVKNENVRNILQKEKETLDKSQSQSQNQSQGAKVEKPKGVKVGGM
jgi:hypothetical protein